MSKSDAGGLCPCAGDRRLHNKAWAKAANDRYDAFTAANPHLRLECIEPCECCPRIDKDLLPEFYDHSSRWKVQGTNEMVVESHLYDFNKARAIEEMLDMPERAAFVTVKSGGTDRSWYFPSRTELVFFGTSSAMETVNLTYSVAHCAPLPVDCENNCEGDSKRDR